MLKPTLALCMIVKNEAKVIRRALESAIPHIDYWVIIDTGSTDGTQEVIREMLANIPGQLHEQPWVNFGFNRAQALALAKDHADYSLILDADMLLRVHAPFKHLLTADAYELRYEGGLDYTQIMLVSNRHAWRYVGVTHEYITSDTMKTSAQLPEIGLLHLCDGGMRIDKFERDARLLTEAVTQDPTNARDTFYLAQTYKDMNQYGQALYWYERRIELGGWPEECWYAMYQAARMMQAIGIKWEQVLAAYLKAYAYRPSRLEPLYEIVKHYRETGEYTVGLTFAAIWGLNPPYPNDRLFIDKPVYDSLLPLEYGLCAFGAQRFTEARRALNHVLDQPNVMANIRAAAEENLRRMAGQE